MPFTHYPKLTWNLLAAWVQPAPPRKPGFLGQPAFADLNRFAEPLKPGDTVVSYHDAQPFTRFMGSIAADQKLEVTFTFANDEVDDAGDFVTDESISKLHYDAEALKQLYDPAKQGASGKYFVTIFGRWLRVEVKNGGDKPTETLRVYVRGSVF